MPSYRDIIRETTFLDVGRRSREVGPAYISSVSQFSNIVEFTINGLTDSYEEYIRVTALDNIETSVLSLTELTTLIKESDLEVACTCPAFTYWGFQYVSAVDDYGLWIAGISPDIRNPQLKGGGCKHIHSILNSWPRFSREIAELYPYMTEEVTTTIRRAQTNRINALQTKLWRKHRQHTK